MSFLKNGSPPLKLSQYNLVEIEENIFIYSSRDNSFISSFFCHIPQVLHFELQFLVTSIDKNKGNSVGYRKLLNMW